jgi:hypothetical protein
MSYKVPRPAAHAPNAAPPPAGDPPPGAATPAAAAPPAELVDDFYDLSAALTGFSAVELLATGVGNLYLEWLDGEFPVLLRELLAAWRTVDGADGLRRAILDRPTLGPFARAVIVLWYTATWSPPDWPWSPGDRPPTDVDRSFGAAYPEGLMWRAALAAHPGGAKPTGFGTWAFPPAEA